jgi:hypothetical protein
MVWDVIGCQGKLGGAVRLMDHEVTTRMCGVIKKAQEEGEKPEYFLVATSPSSNLIGSHTFPENHSHHPSYRI